MASYYGIRSVVPVKGRPTRGQGNRVLECHPGRQWNCGVQGQVIWSVNGGVPVGVDVALGVAFAIAGAGARNQRPASRISI